MLGSNPADTIRPASPIAAPARGLRIVPGQFGTAVALLSHVVAFIQFNSIYGRLDVPSRWYWEFSAVLLLSFILSAVAYVVRDSVRRGFVAVIRLALLLFLSATHGAMIFVEITLLSGLLLDFGMSFSFPVNLVVALFSVLACALAQGRGYSWDVRLSPDPPGARLLLVFYSVVLVALITLLNSQIARLTRQKEIAEQANRASVELARVNIELQSYIITAEQKALINERQRLAQEIHDTVGYVLTNQIMMMEAAVRLIRPEQAEIKDLLVQCRDNAQSGLREVRRSLHELHSMDEIETHHVGIWGVKKLVRAFENTAVIVNLDFGNLSQDFSDEVDSIAYRVVQEGITNALLHGRATRIDISFFQTPEELIIAVSDNGKEDMEGSDHGIGLANLRERLLPLGGTLSASRSSFGFHLAARIPVTSREVAV